MEPETAVGRVFFPQLTGIRFFAAFVVLCHHFAPDLPIAGFASLISRAGDAGVSLFFMLSGFVLTISNRKLDGSMVKNRPDYLVGRFARIYPQYFFSFLFCAPFVLATTFDKYPDHLAAAARLIVNGGAYLLLVQSWIPMLANAWNGPGWSLSTETFFYIAFLFITPPRPEALWKWAAASMAVLFGAAFMVQYVSGPEGLHFWYFFPPMRFGEFALGCCVAQIYRLNLYPRRMSDHSSILCVLCLFAVIVGGTTGNMLAARIATTLAWPMLILALAVGDGIFVRGLSVRPLIALGEASYGLYLIQGPMVYVFNLVTGRDPAPRFENGSEFLAYATMAILASLVLYYLWERPAERFIKRRWKLYRAASMRGAFSMN